MADLAAMTEQIATVLGELETEFTWEAATYTGVRSQLRQRDVMASPGLLGEYETSLLCPSGQFAAVPAAGDTITLGTGTRRILAVETDPIGATYRLHLGHQYSGRKP